MYGSIPSEKTIDKAAKIVHSGRVRPAGIAAVFNVSGDSAIWRVVVFDDGATVCGCPATGRCSHELAALLVHDEAVDRVGVAA